MGVYGSPYNRLVAFYAVWQHGRGLGPEALEQVSSRLANRWRYSSRLKPRTLNRHISGVVTPRDMKLCKHMSLLMLNKFASWTYNFRLYRFSRILNFS